MLLPISSRFHSIGSYCSWINITFKPCVGARHQEYIMPSNKHEKSIQSLTVYLTCSCIGGCNWSRGQSRVLDRSACIFRGQRTGSGRNTQRLWKRWVFIQYLAPCKGSRRILNLNLRHVHFQPEQIIVGKQLWTQANSNFGNQIADLKCKDEK